MHIYTEPKTMLASYVVWNRSASNTNENISEYKETLVGSADN